MRPLSKKSMINTGVGVLATDDDYRMLQNNTVVNQSAGHYLGAFTQTTFRKKRSTSTINNYQKRQQKLLHYPAHQQIIGK